ncbi:hypothetical protein H257_12740 [Aphanomyces astaci]|uniref:DDE-1 domain-containing protein n=1 Tax=Aphanomyces astaci TaxID=112090 RepID=W4FZS7_APHAT|nr:hypothetical protein H257_12740 [Aphanomyces astaci]ETV72279.1 hypothetical protein H257_12740 [Aphanomyces astaci]|eukprot:XP_009838347.1 hypothetical protein H257_12740 [Aphanomyces astaci]
MNGDRGIPITTPMTVTKPVYRQYLVNKVIPAIQAQWPSNRCGPVFIQQDNPKPHVGLDDPQVMEAGSTNGWSIRLTAQPAQSPDFTVLFLGFFNAIQNLQHQTSARTIDDLIKSVQDAFTDLPWRVLDKTIMTLQKVMEESIKLQGVNVYKLPHLRKDVQENAGVRELHPSCDPEVVAALEALESRLADEDLVDEMAELFKTSSDFAQVENIVVV